MCVKIGAMEMSRVLPANTAAYRPWPQNQSSSCRGATATARPHPQSKLLVIFRKTGTASCFAAADTFRARPIEQTWHLGQRGWCEMIKDNYNADQPPLVMKRSGSRKRQDDFLSVRIAAGRNAPRKRICASLKGDTSSRQARPDAAGMKR